LNVAEAREPRPNAGAQIWRRHSWLLKCGAQDLSGLFLHGSVARSGAQAQAPLERIF
jgi:hypothetical protein